MSKITFLPPNYSAPKTTGNYMKIADGENRIRILTQPILGWLDWVDNKPVRYEYNAKPVKPADAAKPIKHFWAFVVWNYAESRIQIMEITQSTVRAALQNLCEDEDWGAPFAYDIKITRKGQKVDTEYAVTPIPAKPVSAEIRKAFGEIPCNLDALFHGDDPFGMGQTSYTPGAFDGTAAKAPEMATTAMINDIQAQEIMDILDDCDDAYKQSVQRWMKSAAIKAKTFTEVPAEHYARLKTAALKRRDEVRLTADSKAMGE